mgnify:FL=1
MGSQREFASLSGLSDQQHADLCEIVHQIMVSGWGYLISDGNRVREALANAVDEPVTDTLRPVLADFVSGFVDMRSEILREMSDVLARAS